MFVRREVVKEVAMRIVIGKLYKLDKFEWHTDRTIQREYSE